MTATQPAPRTIREAATAVERAATAEARRAYGPRATAVRLTTGASGGGFFQAYAPVGTGEEVVPVGPSFLVGAPPAAGR